MLFAGLMRAVYIMHKSGEINSGSPILGDREAP